MGVSGSGKTTIGQQLSAVTGYPFFDADDFHSAANRAKMQSGIPLTDDDRWPWLDSIHDFVTEKIKSGTLIVVCSALKEVYRERLSNTIEKNCRWVFLDGNFDLISQRLQERKGHYMPPALLQSQFDALEFPDSAIQVDITQPPRDIVEQILAALRAWDVQ
jgi:carbohydrate kinase (thermoresistant glucokinase family)